MLDRIASDQFDRTMFGFVVSLIALSLTEIKEPFDQDSNATKDTVETFFRQRCGHEAEQEAEKWFELAAPAQLVNLAVLYMASQVYHVTCYLNLIALAVQRSITTTGRITIDLFRCLPSEWQEKFFGYVLESDQEMALRVIVNPERQARVFLGLTPQRQRDNFRVLHYDAQVILAQRQATAWNFRLYASIAMTCVETVSLISMLASLALAACIASPIPSGIFLMLNALLLFAVTASHFLNSYLSKHSKFEKLESQAMEPDEIKQKIIDELDTKHSITSETGKLPHEIPLTRERARFLPNTNDVIAWRLINAIVGNAERNIIFELLRNVPERERTNLIQYLQTELNKLDKDNPTVKARRTILEEAIAILRGEQDNGARRGPNAVNYLTTTIRFGTPVILLVACIFIYLIPGVAPWVQLSTVGAAVITVFGILRPFLADIFFRAANAAEAAIAIVGALVLHTAVAAVVAQQTLERRTRGDGEPYARLPDTPEETLE